MPCRDCPDPLPCEDVCAKSQHARSGLTNAAHDVPWRNVARDGMPPCDGETVFVGINSAGFACCFNDARPDGLCLMGSPECSTAQMSELRWWRVLDRPESPCRPGSACKKGGCTHNSVKPALGVPAAQPSSLPPSFVFPASQVGAEAAGAYYRADDVRRMLSAGVGEVDRG